MSWDLSVVTAGGRGGRGRDADASCGVGVDVIGADRQGIIYAGRDNLERGHREGHEPGEAPGQHPDAMEGADVSSGERGPASSSSTTCAAWPTGLTFAPQPRARDPGPE